MSSNLIIGRWQSILDNIVRRRKDLEQKIFNKTSCEDKIKTCLNDPEVRNKLNQVINNHIEAKIYCKDAAVSLKYRQKGNELFAGPRPRSALDVYTKAVQFAPSGSEELRLAYGNRSAVLFHVGCFEECLEDILKALPTDNELTDKHCKLLLRKGKAEMKHGLYARSLETFKLIDEVIKKSSVDGLVQSLEKMSLNVESCKESASSGMQDLTNKSASNLVQNPSAMLPSVSRGENNSFAFASSAICVRKNPVKGRHVIANKDLRKGDILFVEKPFAFVVLPEFYRKHCQTCCKLTMNPTPCEYCAGASYCSQKCMEEGWLRFHRWECGVGLDLARSVGIAHLALRLLLVGHSLDVLEPSQISDYSFERNRHQQVLDLVSHVSNMEPTSLFMYTLTAALLATYLEKCTDILTDSSEELLYKMGSRILVHIGQMICNGHSIRDIKADDSLSAFSTSASLEEITIATAIFPSASMMNHSCNHNIVNNFMNQYLIVKATRDIPSGGEVFNCYGPHYTRMPWAARQDALQAQYFFRCECTVCNPPGNSHSSETIIRQHDKYLTGFACPRCDGPAVPFFTPPSTVECLDCKRVYQVSNAQQSALQQANSFVELSEEDFQKARYSDAIKHLLRCFMLRKSILYKYHKDLSEIQSNFSICYAALGEFDKSFSCFQRNIEAVAKRFGSNSIEWANELARYMSVITRAGNGFNKNGRSSFTPVLRIILDQLQRAGSAVKEVYALHYGEWTPMFKNIQKTIEDIRELHKSVCG